MLLTLIVVALLITAPSTKPHYQTALLSSLQERVRMRVVQITQLGKQGPVTMLLNTAWCVVVTGIDVMISLVIHVLLPST